jgi:DNA modification methylase
MISSQLVDRQELGSLISPRRNNNYPVYNWFPYKHSYSKDLVEYFISVFKLSKGSWVLDPFCGSGTTLLACKYNEINSLGYDILPFSVYITNVKLKDYEYNELSDNLNFICAVPYSSNHHLILPDIPIVSKAFSPSIIDELLQLKYKIEKIDNFKIKAFFNSGLLRILESVSNTAKSGGFLRLIERDISSNNIPNIFTHYIRKMMEDVNVLNKLKTSKKVSSKAKLGDSRKLSTKRKFDAIITSPPYLNRHDYTRVYSLEMIFDFVNTNDDLKKIRYNTLRSHVEARKKFKVSNYEKPKKLDTILNEIKIREINNPQIIAMIEGYFEDMYLSLAEMHRCLKKEGKIALVVSNVRFAGVSIPVDIILSDIGRQVGLTTKEILITRYRGNSSQQMKKYKRKPSRESIIIWEK